MFEITNVSNNPLVLSDNKVLAAGATKKVDAVGKREKDFHARGWLNIFEEKPEKPAETNAPPKSEAKTEGGKAK